MMNLWFYSLLPVVVSVLGSAWTAFRRPPDHIIGAVQHFAAGVIFYAAAGELLPQATRTDSIVSILLGGTLGIAALLLLRQLTAKTGGTPTGMISASAVDALIDGLVLGLGFQAGEKQGKLLAIALAIEFLFLGLSIGGSFQGKSRRWKVISAAFAVSIAVPLGVLLSQPLGSLPQPWRIASLTFGLIALLYLVTEELLTEAHEKPETPWGTAAFFIGFLLMMSISQKM